MRQLLARCVISALFPIVLAGTFAAILWTLGRFLPNLSWIKAAAGAAAAGLGLLQAQSMNWFPAPGRSDRLALPPRLARFAWLETLVTPELRRNAVRVFLAGVWIFFSQLATGVFLNKAAGGDLREVLEGNLLHLRGQLGLFHQQHNGAYPSALSELAASGSALRMPSAWSSRADYARRLVPHRETSDVEYYGGEACRGSTNAHLNTINLKDTGRWGYVGDPKSACAGIIFVDCTHADFQGRLWADY